jgi:L-ascorbate metabolism protein UlaG (beta-lactamase superfamily)
MGNNVKVNYLYHSGFSVETENYLLIFDYYKDYVDSGDKNIANGAMGDENLNINKKILVFSSHSHGDHFNPIILDWRKKRNDIRYILSSDIKIDANNQNIYVMSAYEQVKVEEVIIKSFGSTDLGISFLVEVDGYKLFHSGDLNWWYWWDDTEEEKILAESNYKKEISRIKEEKIDIAFFPVDPRLEENYSAGGQYFINELYPRVFIPMHFGDKYNTTKAFKAFMKDTPTCIIEITHRGQEFIL